ncbi:ROK family protein [Actinocatenispora sera]|uniref:ROK family protein n=1 Tax=Actinocatenispora sera TaxID=390989 RepID=UPI0033D137ED
MTEPEVYAGVDIGGTTTQVALCAPDLSILSRAELATPASRGGAAMVAAAVDAVRMLVSRTPARLLGVGVGAAGVVDTRTGAVVAASDSFVDWAGFPVADTIAGDLAVPAYLDNDVNAFLRGEATGGAVAGEPYVLGMTLGTGVGGALWLDGRLYEGPHGAAGEIGHVPGFGDLPCSCGGRGHLETLASGRAIAARYADRTGRVATARDIARAAEGGDPAARAVFDAAGTGIARAVLITAGVVDVTTVVVGGGVSAAWSLLEPPIRAALAAEPPVSGQPICLVRAGLGSDAVVVGAASRARTELTDPAALAPADFPR